jgi:hypothetical protein
MDYLQVGFANVMCRKLAEETRNSLEKDLSGDGNELIVHFADTLKDWTDEIQGSDSDVYENEVGRSHMPKRTLKREFFQEGWLKSLLKKGTQNKVPSDSKEPPPLEDVTPPLDE